MVTLVDAMLSLSSPCAREKPGARWVCALGVRVGCVRAARMEEVRAVYLHLGVRSFGIEFKVISVGLLIAFVSFPLFFPH